MKNLSNRNQENKYICFAKDQRIRTQDAFALLFTFTLFLFAPGGVKAQENPIIIGLNADMSTADAESGQSIKLGAMAAIEQINAQGGVLGRNLSLKILDHRRNPARGKINMQTFGRNPDVIAVLGGKHTPVVLAELETVHELKIPYLIPWAAGTTIIENGFTPNYVFRVSVRDEYAGGFLARYAARQGLVRPGLVLEQTGWGRSNEKSLVNAFDQLGITPAWVEWFNWGESCFMSSLERLHRAGADSFIFVGNSPDGVSFIRSILQHPESMKTPIISHWGIAGGDFEEILGADLDRVNLAFLQTFSFFDPPFPERAQTVFELLQKVSPDIASVRDIKAPTGVAHAYDLVHILSKAINLAGISRREDVREALENVPPYHGLMRDYKPAFTPQNHDALDADDFRMARFVQGIIKPIKD
ncbi:ABC transporter substrate-binding protein [Desulfonatronovibrio magnus]|uniref:ABC transporter substrate-binding protein n=1 Tax=Desulfonatronovibrio magnus TaxID=698827 RepID=UPI000A06E923|nr:ABC transporter substrate-binding protein [Desulfonatronovibrio magnus]